MRTYLILLLLIFFAVPAQAGDDHISVFEKGNAYYEKGDYDGAIREYSKLSGQGIESGNLYFNLGNCYFRNGEIGKAILYYEKAKRLIPGDTDLQFNYGYVISRAGIGGQQTSGAWSQRVTGWFGGLSVDGLTILVSVLYLLIVMLFIAAVFINIRKRYFIVSIILLLSVFVSGAVSLYGRTSVIDREAIVTAKSPEAKFEPSDSATTYFPLSEGMKIYVLEKKNGWVKIGRPDGKAGWVKKEMIETY